MNNNKEIKKNIFNLGNIEFVFIEFAVFLSQALVIFIVTFFLSDMLKNEERLTTFVTSKLNDFTISELGLTLFAVTFVLGLFYIIKEMSTSSLVERIASELIDELPRTIYLFGSSITAITAALAIFLLQNPDSSQIQASRFFVMSLFIGISFFGYGCLIKAGLKRKKAQTG